MGGKEFGSWSHVSLRWSGRLTAGLMAHSARSVPSRWRGSGAWRWSPWLNPSVYVPNLTFALELWAVAEMSFLYSASWLTLRDRVRFLDNLAQILTPPPSFPLHGRGPSWGFSGIRSSCLMTTSQWTNLITFKWEETLGTNPQELQTHAV